MHRRAFGATLLAILYPLAARAQTVRGAVLDAGDQPVPGVVVLLVDSASRDVARSLSDVRGEFRVEAGRGGTYRLRTLRIGYRPTVSEPFVLRAGGEVTQRLVLTGVPVSLETMRVVDRSECRAFSDSGAATFAVWEQIRTALTAAQVAEGSRAIASTTVAYERTLDPGSDRILRQKSSVSTDFATRPWRTPPPDTLRRAGYVVTLRDNTVEYYAPGLDALLSTVFVEDHCFRLTDDRKQPALLGLSFEPIPERKSKAAEIRGTIWVDRASSELRALDLRFVNVSPVQEQRAAGRLEFVRMRDGTWAVSRWNIRMPVIEQFIIPGHGAEERVTAMQVSGGELALARRGADTLWSQPARSLAGMVIDSSSGKPVSGARVAVAGTGLEAATDSRGRFTIAGILPGQYTVDIHTASLDSLNSVYPSTLTVTDLADEARLRVPNGAQFAAMVCGSAAADGGATGIVVGRLMLEGDPGQRRSLDGARVTAEFQLDSGHVNRMEAPAARDGSFRLCRLPMNAAVTLRAAADSAGSAEPTVVRLSPASRVARVQLRLEPASLLARRGAVFTGVVVFDSTRAPIIGAEVALPDVAMSTLTDATGGFRLADIPAGEHQILVRRLGYGAAETRLTFQGNESVERRIVLGRAIVLEPVVVSEHASDRVMASFDENRRVGLGHFLTRADLAKVEGVTVGSLLEQIPGATIIRGNSGAWIRSSRAFGINSYLPDKQDSIQGAKPAACYSQVYLNEMLMFNGRVSADGLHFEPLFNLNDINPAQIEAIEFYASPAETPLRYSRMESQCGVLVIWTRRSP